MLAVSPLRTNNNEREGEIESFSIGSDDFSDFSGGNLLDCIDFDDLFVGVNDEDVLPDLEMDPKILAEFSVGSGEESEMNTSSVFFEKLEDNSRKNDEDKFSGSGNSSGSSWIQGEEIVSKKGESDALNASTKEADKGRKSSTQSKNRPDARRKVKVDWTPELHRRFVQAVEQLGVDKAVPSRILEIMGTDCLTRHNVASHLQKYRSHKKHLLAREAEAASWNQRRQLYSSAAAGGGKRDMHPWPATTMGFPHMTPMHHFRPLHVWGHPSVDQSLMHVWPKHLPYSPPPAAWAPPPAGHPPPAPDPYFWHAHHQRVKNSLTPGTPCFPPRMAPTRFHTPPVPGIPPPHAMYKVDPGIGVRTAPNGQPCPQPPFDFHPSKESVDAAIGDVLSEPRLPLPLGLKPPSIDGVLGELQRQGISKIPPTCA